MPINAYDATTPADTDQASGAAAELRGIKARLNTQIPQLAPILQAAASWVGATPGTNVPTSGFNVTSIQRISAGNYLVNFTNPLPDVNYFCSIVAVCGASVPCLIGRVVYNKLVGSFQFDTQASNGAPQDPISLDLLIFGA